MHRGLLDAGLVPCDVIRQELGADPGGGSRFAQAVAPSLSTPGIAVDDRASRATEARLIWRVRRFKRPHILISGNMLTPVGGVSHVRVVHPLQAIGTDPLVRVGVTDTVDAVPASDGTARIFILHRPALTRLHGKDMLRGLIAAGHLVVTEFDDHPDFFPMMQLGGELSFRGVHALQTSTPALAEILRQYNPEIAVFPNAISSVSPPHNFDDPNTITCFFGALNREQDWRPLTPAINAVAHTAGKRLKFQVVHDRGFFRALETPHKIFTPTCDYDTYLRLLSGCEISLMPLSDTPFNRAKSDLKFIEAGSCRVAPLASSVVYGDTRRGWPDRPTVPRRDRTP